MRALTQSGGQDFIVVAPLLIKRRRDFYKRCRNKTGIAKEVPNSIYKDNPPQPLGFFNRSLFCGVLSLLPDRERLKIDTDGLSVWSEDECFCSAEIS